VPSSILKARFDQAQIGSLWQESLVTPSHLNRGRDKETYFVMTFVSYFNTAIYEILALTKHFP